MRLRAAACVAFALATAALASAPAVPSSAAGHCTRAAADQVALRLHLEADPGEKDPVAQVLCGAFLGPGVEAMAASIRIPSCGRTGDWLVFRFEGGAWQRAFESHGGADLAAVGPDVRETQYVLKPADAHCFPTGGTRSRTWHWNGSRLVEGAWKYSQPASAAAATLRLYQFQSPSHNLGCDIQDEDVAYCSSVNLPHTVALHSDGTMKICTGAACFGPGGPNTSPSTAPTLAYGAATATSLYRCTSATAGITCTVIRPGPAYGKGFLIDAAGVTRVP